MSLSKAFDTAISLVAGIVLVASGVVLLGGPGRDALLDMKERVAMRAAIRNAWPELAAPGSRLYPRGERPVTLIEFSDYECPFCRQMSPLLDSIAAETDEGIAYRHFPLPSHKMARQAALAAICADKQGAFLAMHNRLMTSDEWKDGNWKRESELVGITDQPQFMECLVSAEANAQLEQDIALGKRMKVTATPTFITSDGIRVGALTRAELMEMLNR